VAAQGLLERDSLRIKMKGGLSTGAQAGIGVGIGIAGLLFIGALIFFLLRKRKAKSKSYGAVPTYETDGRAAGLVEADDGTLTELPTEEDRSRSVDPRVPQEIYGEQIPCEQTVDGTKVHPVNPGALVELDDGSPTRKSPESRSR